MQTIWRAAIKANIFLLPHIHYMGLWKQIHLHNKGVQTFISILHAHLRFKKVLYSVTPPTSLTKLQSQREKKMMFFKTGNIASTVKRILQGVGGSSFLFYFWLKEKMEALYNLTTIFRSPELKCHIFNRLYSLRCFILFSISNFLKFLFYFILFIFVYYSYYYLVYTSTLPQFQTKFFYFSSNFSLRM